MNAGLMVGLDLLILINEPIASAISYGLINKEGLIAIYDLGSRNFDVSILQSSDGNYLNIVGKHDPFLSGEDFDNVVVEYLVSEIKCIHGIDATIGKLVVQMLRQTAKKAKVTYVGDRNGWRQAKGSTVEAMAHGELCLVSHEW
ncbi:hypothetical protein IFM89_028256 [Coptis chinensis]|uniref:Heat shock protein 70 n=1 Tax=Coptis chinensis TaxID=261450 RepID=A0A835M6S6_9MAGN|nr:hypothetical protein IFM89_028256 [Coptis chinensis]